FLYRLDRAVRLVELEMRALHRDELLGPQPLHRFEAFLEPLAEPRARHAERLELDVAVADAAAEDELAVRQDVQCRELLGEIERLVQWEQDEATDEPQFRRNRRRISKEWDLLHRLEWMRAVMGALDDAVEADFLGALHELQIVAQVPGD